MLMRFDPFRDLDRVTQVLTQPGSRTMAMPLDAYREGDRFMVQFDLPGVDPSSIDLTVEKNVLSVTAERPRPAADGRNLLIAERPYGTFTRQLFLSDTLDADRIEATYANGVLTVTIPVAEQAKPRRVQIAAGDADGQPVAARSGAGGAGESTGAEPMAAEASRV